MQRWQPIAYGPFKLCTPRVPMAAHLLMATHEMLPRRPMIAAGIGALRHVSGRHTIGAAVAKARRACAFLQKTN